MEVHSKYIQATFALVKFRKSRIYQESNFYNPEKVKNSLKEVKLSDQLPLITVCDQFDLSMISFSTFTRMAEVYVQRVNSVRAPEVVGGAAQC